jgi:hypothetical protein
MMQEDHPLFDSAIKALVFAFNAAEAYYIASPTMNTMMAAVPNKPTRRSKALMKQLASDQPDGPSKARPSPPPAQPGELLRGLNKAAQAGFILKQICRLEPVHYRVLEARFTRPAAPCACRSSCCQGWKPTLRWSGAIVALCELLKESGDITKTPGKRGLSTEPRLRRMLVEGTSP